MLPNLPAVRQTPSQATLFAVQTVLAALVSFALYGLLHRPGAVWCVVSAILVLQPELSASRSTALARSAANLIGAVIGAGVANTFGGGYAAIAAVILVASGACYLLRLDTGLKAALACGIIVLLGHGNGSVWTTSLERVAAVVIGCVVALALHACFVGVGRMVGGVVHPQRAGAEQMASQQEG